VYGTPEPLPTVDPGLPEARVFPGMNGNAVGAMMTRACQRAGAAAYTPHDLRHRWISVQVARGVPITDICAHVGHANKALTLDTYSHVLLDDERGVIASAKPEA
jgi:integrase